MKIALIGYGKMGQEVEKVLLKRGHDIFVKGTSKSPLFRKDLEGADVAIEFSRPESAVQNLIECFNAKTPVISGTTGWYERLPEVRSICAEYDGALFYASNFSLGVHIFQFVNRFLAKCMKDFGEYQPSITEIHHKEKLDAPSGTAITSAEVMLDELSNWDDWTMNETQSDKLLITAERKPDVKGIHILSYTSDIDIIELKHEAHSRKGFALGAVKAAEWIKNKKGVYSMQDMLKLEHI
mgnify:CR=1 FL=1